MRHKIPCLTILISAMLASCSRHESSLTGSYGGKFVTGQVVMAADVANSSPAGVEVAVVGTAMTSTLAADGRFSFMGVPDGAELSFRRADGIDVRLRVSAASPVIELGKTTAGNGHSRRRSVSPKDPAPSQQIEGVIQTPGTDSIVILDEHQRPVTVAIDSSTLIRKGNRNIRAADLEAGDRVHVKALLKDNKPTATQIVVQEADDDDNRDHDQEIEGIVINATATSLKVGVERGPDVEVAIDGSTIVRKGNQTINPTDLERGDRVHVKATLVDNKLTAREVIVQQEDGHDGDRNGMEVEGSVASVSGSSLVVHGERGDITVNTGDKTVIRKHDARLAVADIKPGDRVEAKGTRVDENTLNATDIEVEDGSGHH